MSRLPVHGALARKEARELLLGRAFWPLQLVLALLVGASFRQAQGLYAEASRAAATAPELSRGLVPFEGILVPTFGAVYLVTTLLWPFVAIRQLAGDKQSGALKLFQQLPIRFEALLLHKLLALAFGWLLVLAVPSSAAAIWWLLGGHLPVSELVGLLVGHTLYALVVTSLSFAAAAWCDSAPTASLFVLAATLGSWAVDFAAIGDDGLLALGGAASLTRVLRPWEQGLALASNLSLWLVVSAASIAIASVGLRPGRLLRARLARLASLVLVVVAAAVGAGQLRFSRDLTQERRNSFSAAEEAALSRIEGELRVDVFLAVQDPRYVELERTILSRLRRAVPRIAVRLTPLAGGRFGPGEDERYGEVVYSYEGRHDVSRSTSPREVLPLIWALTDVVPGSATSDDYPGFPLVPEDPWSGPWFYCILPLLIGAGATARWWRGDAGASP